MRTRYPAPTGYAPGGVAYLPYPKRPPTTRTRPVATTTQNGPPTNISSIFARLRPNANADPYAPLSDDEITRRVRERIAASTDPVLAEITRSINAQAERSIAGLRGYTEAQAAELGKAQGVTAGIYGRAEERQSAVDSALAGQARGEGDASAAALATRLASVNAPTATGEQTTALTTAGQGSALAEYAGHSADLSALVASGTAEENLAAQYPRLARLIGAQGIRQIAADASSNIADQTGQVRSQIPGMVGDLEADYRTNELTKANARLARTSDDRDYKEGKREFDLTLSENRKIRQAQLDADTTTAVVRAGNDALDRAARGAEKAADRAFTASEKAKDRALRASEGGKDRAAATAKAAAKTAADARKAATKARQKADTAAGGARKNRSDAVSGARETAVKRARELAKGEVVKTAGGTLTPGGKTVVTKSYSQAFAQIYNEISPDLVHRYAMNPSAIRQIVTEALAAAGFSRPQRRGGQ